MMGFTKNVASVSVKLVVLKKFNSYTGKTGQYLK